MGSKFTKYDLDHVTDYIEFEAFASDLMSLDGFKGIEPLGGHKDRGRDAIDIDRSSHEVTVFAYSVREDWEKKLNEDLEIVHKEGHVCNHIVFVTTGSPTPTQKDNKRDAVRNQYNWSLDFYDLERISTIVDTQHPQLRTLHPGIFTISSHLTAQATSGNNLDKETYAQYVLARHHEWIEKYTPLLAEHREIETFVARLDQSSPPVALSQVADLHEVSLLLGESGSGKTTATWRIAVDKATTILNHTSQQIPILISLRGWSSQHTCRTLVQDQFDLLDVSHESIEQELRQGNCLLLIDGLNELPAGEAMRTEAYQELQRFLSTYQRNRFVICCRAADYQSRMLHSEGAPRSRLPHAYEIQRMGRSQVVDYINRYFGDDRASADDLISKLGVTNDDIWQDKKSIVHLARIPLYLQLFISEYERTQQLPNSQVRLLYTLVSLALERERSRQAAGVDSSAKKQLLAQFAYRAASEGYSLQLPESYATGILGESVSLLKAQSVIQADLTLAAIWQEIISNNFLKIADWRTVEWIHQLLFDFFLGSQIAHIWVNGDITDRGHLRARLSYTWSQACAIGLGLLAPTAGAHYLEFLIGVSSDLARFAFEVQTESEQELIADALVTDVIEEADPDTERLKLLTVNFPSEVVVETLRNKFRTCPPQLEPKIAEAMAELMIEHSPKIAEFRSRGYVSYGFDAERHESVSLAVRRVTPILVAWTNSTNPLIQFHAARGLWEADKGLAADTFKKLLESQDNAIVNLVKDVMDEWGIQ